MYSDKTYKMLYSFYIYTFSCMGLHWENEPLDNEIENMWINYSLCLSAINTLLVQSTWNAIFVLRFSFICLIKLLHCPCCFWNCIYCMQHSWELQFSKKLIHIKDWGRSFIYTADTYEELHNTIVYIFKKHLSIDSSSGYYLVAILKAMTNEKVSCSILKRTPGSYSTRSLQTLQTRQQL